MNECKPLEHYPSVPSTRQRITKNNEALLKRSKVESALRDEKYAANRAAAIEKKAAEREARLAAAKARLAAAAGGAGGGEDNNDGSTKDGRAGKSVASNICLALVPSL